MLLHPRHLAPDRTDDKKVTVKSFDMSLAWARNCSRQKEESKNENSWIRDDIVISGICFRSREIQCLRHLRCQADFAGSWPGCPPGQTVRVEWKSHLPN